MPLDQEPNEEKEMSFLDHLEELRWHLIRSLAAVIVFTIIAFVSADGFLKMWCLRLQDQTFQLLKDCANLVMR